MIVIKALLLFVLCGGTFSQNISQACIYAQAQLRSDPECEQAYIEVANAANMTNATDAMEGDIALATLTEYCSPSCRSIVEDIARECVSETVYNLVAVCMINKLKAILEIYVDIYPYDF